MSVAVNLVKPFDFRRRSDDHIQWLTQCDLCQRWNSGTDKVTHPVDRVQYDEDSLHEHLSRHSEETLSESLSYGHRSNLQSSDHLNVLKI